MTGFIPGSRGSFMLDLVAVAMVVILPVFWTAINFAKSKSYTHHKRLMIAVTGVLLIAVIAFELEMRTLGWTQLAEASPYFKTSLPYVLGVHIFCSTTASIAIATTLFLALKKFNNPALPNAYSPHHKKLGKLSAVSLAATSVTGWVFYWMAFVAS